MCQQVVAVKDRLRIQFVVNCSHTILEEFCFRYPIKIIYQLSSISEVVFWFVRQSLGCGRSRFLLLCRPNWNQYFFYQGHRHRKVSIAYREPEFLSYRMIWGHPPRPLQASVGELYIQGVERQRGGKPFRTEKEVGGPKSYDSLETLVLYIQNTRFTHHRSGFRPQSTYICRVQSSVLRLPKYWPPTSSPPSECALSPHQRRGGVHIRRAVRGVGDQYFGRRQTWDWPHTV